MLCIGHEAQLGKAARGEVLGSGFWVLSCPELTQHSELLTQNCFPLFLAAFLRLSAGDVFLTEQFCEVGALKAKLFGCFGLVPSISAQRFLDDLPTICVHTFMVMARRRPSFGFSRLGDR